MEVPSIITAIPKINQTVFGYACFSLLNKIFQVNYTKKQADNLISGVHAASALILTTTSIYNLRWISTAYFLFDTVQTLKRGKLGVMEYAYIYHHLACVYLLLCDSEEVPIENIFFWGELSNIFNYPLYHYIHEKQGNHTKKIEIFRKLQKLFYATIRMPICSKNFYHYISTTKTPHHICVLFPVYIMGIIWSMKILSQ